MKAVKNALIATASAGALFALLGTTAASATPIFTIAPDAIPGITGYSPVQESDIAVSSDSTIVQTNSTTQTETGWAEVTGFSNNGALASFLTTGQFQETNDGIQHIPDTYGLYFKYTAVVNGITGFTAGQIGTIAPGGFTYSLTADVTDNDIFHAGSTGPSPTNPSVTDTGGNDIVLAEGTSISGSAGFQASTGAPTINAVTQFIICDGTVNQGHLANTVITGGAATGCGTFNALNYFTNPTAFYNVAFLSATSGSANDLTVDNTDHNATLNGVVADVNFTQVPEPQTLAMFGFGLIGLGWFVRRRAKNA